MLGVCLGVCHGIGLGRTWGWPLAVPGCRLLGVPGCRPACSTVCNASPVAPEANYVKSCRPASQLPCRTCTGHTLESHRVNAAFLSLIPCPCPAAVTRPPQVKATLTAERDTTKKLRKEASAAKAALQEALDSSASLAREKGELHAALEALQADMEAREAEAADARIWRNHLKRELEEVGGWVGARARAHSATEWMRSAQDLLCSLCIIGG